VRKFLVFLAAPALALAQPVTPKSPDAPAEMSTVPASADSPVAELQTSDAVILGLVEGVTEFLPISSTGHLILANHFLGLESEQPLLDERGQPLWHKRPSAKHPEGIPLTPKLAADTFTVVIQFGAIAAVALLYWSQFMAMARGLIGQDSAGLRLLIRLIIAFLPAAIVGLLAHDLIDRYLFGVKAVIFAQVTGAFLMIYAERWRKKRASTGYVSREPADMSLGSAAGIGLMQCVAMWPGTSRSMMVIVGCYFADLDPKRSAEFSFLLGFVTLTAASVYKSYQSGAAMIAVFGWPHVLLGCVVAAVAAAIAVRFFVGWLSRHGLGLFAYYRLILAAGLTAWFFL
jgi:undecaprenyl-diphosphatase